MPLRGKTDETTVFNSLFILRVNAGDTILNGNLQNFSANATYISHRIQSEFINICNEVLLEHIIKDEKKSQFFSVIAESSDISGTEWLLLGLHFIHKMSTGEFCVREEFLGFEPL